MPRCPCWANALPRAMVTAANATPVQSLRLFCKVMAFSLPPSRRYPDGMPSGALSTALPVRNAKRPHVGADTCRVHSVVTRTLEAGGAHVDAASLLVDDDPDDDIVGEAEPPALLTRFDATCIDIGGNDGPARHRCRDIKGLVEGHRHRQPGRDRHHVGVGTLLQLCQLQAAIIYNICTFSRARRYDGAERR